MSGEEVTGSGLETDNGIAAAAGEPHYSPQDEGGAAEDPAAMGRCGGMSGCRVAAVVVAVLVACLGVAMLAGGYNAIFNAALKSQLEIKEGSRSYEIWRKTPFPLILKVYLFNITNAEAFEKGAKPDVQECGPYVWREYREKKNITFNPNNTVTYFQQRYWVWDEELSGNNSRDDVIVTLNTVPVAAAWAVHTSEFLLGMLNGMFNSVKEKAVVTTTAEQILFTGYEDPVLDWLKEHPSFASGISYDKFAWFYGRNLTTYYDGLFNMKTGVDTLENLGKIDWWNKTRSTPFFSPPCNNVTGSAGEMFPPNQKPNHVVIYSSDLCMSVKLHYKENVTNDGIKGYRFWGSNTTFANGSVVAGNECYCVKGTCAPTGLLNAESCRMGAPAFISFPHFFNADPYLLNMVNGLKPEEKKHAFYMDLIPELGTPMNVAARVQINIRIQPYQGTGKFHFNRIDILKDLPNAYLPMLWFEEKAAMPPDMAPSVKFLLFLMNTPTLTIVWSLLVAIGVIVVVGLLLDHWRRHRSYDPLLDPLM